MAITTSDRRDLLRRQRSETDEGTIDYPARLPPTTGDVALSTIKAMIDQVSGASVSEIDRLIAELSSVRDMLRSEAERIQREVEGYASTSEAATTSMKTIADSLAHWKSKIL